MSITLRSANLCVIKPIILSSNHGCNDLSLNQIYCMKYCTKFYAEYHINTANIDNKVCWKEYNISAMECVGCIFSMRDICKY